VLALRDADGVTYREALASYGDEGAPLPARVARGGIAAYVELHIEQGGVLERLGVPIGAVTAIAGLVQRSVRFEGVANHAGTTPMDLRRDALLAAAEWALGVERCARAVGGGTVGTVGRFEVQPGGRNIIPGSVEAICDLRAPNASLLDILDGCVVAALQQSARRSVSATPRLLQRVEPGPMDERVVAAVERAASAAGFASHRMVSGAIHDALHVAEVCPASMIFVPSRGGRSHCPEESTDVEHLAAGATVLAHALAALAA
jgi:hydantoinase/carbamoylase family amidase